MEDVNVIEGNKIICVFMDGEVMEDGMCWFRKYHHIRTSLKCFHIKSVKYHLSWDWIIPALRKAKATIHSSEWDGWPSLNTELMRCEKPEYLIPHLVSFITWHNNQPKL